MIEQPEQRGSAGAAPGSPPELPKQYRPADHEGRIRARWEASKAFHADPERVLSGQAEPYCVLIPPPNVTAALHLGHALNNTLQDVLVRAHRMMGYETLWMPGTDHAGIATQAVVEKRVLKDEGKRRQQFTREEFVAKIQAFKDEYEATITGQLKAMGCSCDWDRQRFTMDPVCARAVYEAFFRLFKDGLIYRGKRLVNWDPVLQTAVADDETEDIEIDGQMYYLRYPLVHAHGSQTPREAARGRGPQDPVPVTWSELRARGWPAAHDAEHEDDRQAWVTVATSRPETYLGDSAVAVNPKDPRAKALRGLRVELPLIGRVIPIVEDDYVVLPAAMQEDPEAAKADPKAAIATGFLKVTPAHDPNDYEIGRRHSLDIINVLAPDASISDKHGWTDVGGGHIFVGKPREEARKLVIREFKDRTVGGEPGAAALFAKSVPYRHSVPHSDRSKAVIEPYLSDQWYVRVTDERMAPAANRGLVADQKSSKQHSGKAQSAGDGELRFHPDRYAKTYESWHDNIRDWCISRQLWWGHRIPVWTETRGRERLSGVTTPQLRSIEGVGVQIAQWQAEGRLAVSFDSNPNPADRVRHVCLRDDRDQEIIGFLEQQSFVRDPDVLDTWFSSGLWPMSTMGWPEPPASMKGLLEAFNPSSTLCTAREIITLWVSRMVMFNRYLMPEGWEQAKKSPSPNPLPQGGGGRGPLPFRDVFIHCVIQDGEGRKMSKSLGNGVDPLDIIDSHGADAMRYTLAKMATQTQDVRLPVARDPASGKNTSPKFDEGRNFCNKLWNAARYAIGILESPLADSGPRTQDPGLSLVDRWMLSRLASGVAAVEAAIREYQFSEYTQAVYDLLWRDFCDWYLEAIKPTVGADPRQRAVLAHALDTIVRLLHPIAPFVTEAIWERLRGIKTAPVAGVDLGPARKGDLLCTAGWPRVAASLRDETAEREFDRVRALVTAIREVRAKHQVPPKRRITLHAPRETIAGAAAGLIQNLAGVEAITADAPAGPAVTFTFESVEHRVSNLADAVDAGAEKARLEKQVADLARSIDTFEKRLANPGYTDRAPPAMVQQTRDQMAKAKAEHAAAVETLGRLG